MLKKTTFVLAAGALLLLAATPGFAQDVNGSVSGTVTGPDGAALPGVSVTLTGTGFPGGKVSVTGGQGKYRFPTVPPGDYTMTATLDGFANTEAPQFRVTLESALEANFEMALAAVAEAINVTSEVPIISITASDTSAVISDEWIEKMPVERDFTGVITQAAGANDEDELLGGISIDGSSGAENRFVIDGIDTTDLQTGVAGKRLITDFIEQVQVKQGGYMAEFGGGTGGVINAVTKTGGNEFDGEAHLYWEDDGLYGDERLVLRDNPTTGAGELVDVRDDDRERYEPGFTIGGPIMQDKMWFFAGYSPSFIDTTRTVRYSDGSSESFNQEVENTYVSANVSGSFGKVLYRAGVNVDDQERTNLLPTTDGLGSRSVDAYAEDRESPGLSYTVNLDWLPSNTNATTLRGGHFEYDTQDTGFFTGLWWGPSTLSAGTACEQFPAQCDLSQDPPLGSATPNNTGTLFDLFERDYLQADTTFFVDQKVGSHELKGGALFEEIGNDVLDGYSNTRILYYIDAARTNLEGVAVRGPFGHYRVLQIATQGEVSSDNQAIFVQDSWRVNDRLTLNLGLRAEEEKIPSYAAQTNIPSTAISFDYDDTLAPRLGFAYDVKGDGKWKAYGSYGLFFDKTKLEMPRGSFGGDKWVDYFYALETLDFASINAGCRIVNNSIDSLPEGCPGEFLFLADRRFPSNNPEDPTIDPNLKPMEANEITIGVEHLLGNNMSVGARIVRKELDRTIEDVGLVVPGVGEVFFIANPGEGIATNVLGPEFPNQPRPEREYTGLTLTFRKNYSEKWALSATYTYSELEGNYSGLSSSDEDGRTSPNVNRFFDSLQGSFDQNANPVFGKLGTDRPHQFKAQFIHALPWDSSIGVNQRFASGTPVSTEYSVSPGLPFFPFGRGDLGRTDSITQTDVMLAKEFAIGGDRSLEVTFNIRNLFDEDAVTDIDNSRLDQDLPLSEEEFFAGFNADQVIADNNVELDGTFGLPENFQGRREIRLGLRFRF